MKNRYTSLNIMMRRSDKLALLNYAFSQGESVSVIVRKMIKEELLQKGFLQPMKKEDIEFHQVNHLETNHLEEKEIQNG